MAALNGGRRHDRLSAGLALIAGAAAGFAHPPWGFLPGLLGYGLMAWAVDRASPGRPVRSAFWRGWLAGCGYFAVSLHWIIYPFFVDAQNQAWMAPFALGFMVAGMAVFWGAAMVVYRACAASGVQRVLLFAGVLAGFEWLRGHILTGFPWDLPGETWAAGSSPSQLASVVGAYGLTWITLAIFATAAVAIGEGRRGRITVALGLAGVVALTAYGEVRLGHPPMTDPHAPWVRVVQPNLPQLAQYDQASFDHILNKYVSMTSWPAGHRPDIVVWPEGAVPAALEDYLAPGSWTGFKIGETLNAYTTLLIGGYRFADDSAPHPTAFNSLVAVRRASGGVGVIGLYDKFRLVPFGEYIPLDSLAGRLGIKEMVHVGDGFTSGPRPRPMPLLGLPPAQPLICYEVLFPGFTHEGTTASGLRPMWIVNVSTDAWFGAGAGPLQHFNLARYRAIEEGLPMVRATPTGVSGVIDAFGRVAPGMSLGEGATGVIDAPLPPALPPTLFSRWGDAGFWLMMLVSLIGIRPFWRREKTGAAA